MYALVRRQKAMQFFETNLGYVRDSSNDVVKPGARLFPRKPKRHPRTAIYRRPDGETTRAWDHFAPFA